MAELMQENPDANVGLTDANLSDVKRQLSSFSMSYSDQKFENTYDLQYSLEAAVLEYANFNALGNLDSIAAGRRFFCAGDSPGVRSSVLCGGRV